MRTYNNNEVRAYSDSHMNWETMEYLIQKHNMSGEDVLHHLTDYHGLRLLSGDFMDNLLTNELGYTDDAEEEEEEE